MLYINKVKDFFKGTWSDFKVALNQSKGTDLVEKTNEVLTNNISRVWGMKWKNIYIIFLFILPLLFAGIKDDFKILKNLTYAVSSDVVIEESIKNNEETIEDLKLKNAVLESENTQLKKTNEQVFKQFNILKEILDAVNEIKKEEPVIPKEEDSQ